MRRVDDETLSKAILGAMALVVALMLEVSYRLRNRPASEVHVTPDVVVLEQPETPKETDEGA